jgi:hypothetical protein
MTLLLMMELDEGEMSLDAEGNTDFSQPPITHTSLILKTVAAESEQMERSAA